MRFIGKLVVIIVVVLLIGTTGYGLYYFYGGTNDNNNDHEHNETDTEPPTITFVTGDVTVIAGQTVTISAEFSDNVDVTEATLSYKTANASEWISVSILTGSASLSIPTTATENYYYYITVNDAASNGPVGDPSVDGNSYFIITVRPQGDGGNSSNNGTYIHQVFIEETTSEECHFCPNVGRILENLTNDPLYQNRFYYVSMIMENSKAATYLNTTYNWPKANPTVYFDAGYNVIVGGLNPEIDYSDAILTAEERPVPQIRVTVTADYHNTTNTVNTTVLTENNETVDYSGHLRVYLLEIISTSYNDYDGQKYKNAFVDFVVDQDISIPAKGQTSYTANWSKGSLDLENLKLIAVIYNDTGHTAYTLPPDGYPFTAHYADAVNATYVVKGERNLPPEVGIVSPQKGKIYIRGHLFGNKFLYKKSLLRNTHILGKATISAYAKDDSGIAKVEFYLNGKLVANMTKAPYNWTTPFKLFKKPILPKTYTIMVKAYDDTNKNATASITVRAWWAF